MTFVFQIGFNTECLTFVYFQPQHVQKPRSELALAVTFGFRLPLFQWRSKHGTLKENVWDRYYLDCLCHFNSEPLTFSRIFAEMVGTLASMIAFDHRASIMSLVESLATESSNSELTQQWVTSSSPAGSTLLSPFCDCRSQRVL